MHSQPYRTPLPITNKTAFSRLYNSVQGQKYPQCCAVTVLHVSDHFPLNSPVTLAEVFITISWSPSHPGQLAAQVALQYLVLPYVSDKQFWSLSVPLIKKLGFSGSLDLNCVPCLSFRSAYLPLVTPCLPDCFSTASLMRSNLFRKF